MICKTFLYHRKVKAKSQKLFPKKHAYTSNFTNNFREFTDLHKIYCISQPLLYKKPPQMLWLKTTLFTSKLQGSIIQAEPSWAVLQVMSVFPHTSVVRHRSSSQICFWVLALRGQNILAQFHVICDLLASCPDLLSWWKQVPEGEWKYTKPLED